METPDWLWTLSGIIWLIGAVASFRLAKFAKNELAILASFGASFVLGITGLLVLLLGLGIAAGDSDPWEHVAVLLMIGNVYSVYCAWRVIRHSP